MGDEGSSVQNIVTSLRELTAAAMEEYFGPRGIITLARKAHKAKVDRKRLRNNDRGCDIQRHEVDACAPVACGRPPTRQVFVRQRDLAKGTIFVEADTQVIVCEDLVPTPGVSYAAGYICGLGDRIMVDLATHTVDGQGKVALGIVLGGTVWIKDVRVTGGGIMKGFTRDALFTSYIYNLILENTDFVNNYAQLNSSLYIVSVWIQFCPGAIRRNLKVSNTANMLPNLPLFVAGLFGWNSPATDINNKVYDTTSAAGMAMGDVNYMDRKWQGYRQSSTNLVMQRVKGLQETVGMARIWVASDQIVTGFRSVYKQIMQEDVKTTMLDKKAFGTLMINEVDVLYDDSQTDNVTNTISTIPPTNLPDSRGATAADAPGCSGKIAIFTSGIAAVQM
ncbi:MAG: hypothetical protein Hyperionvirus3_36 [Hyperionvirus sp.]|uniref:Uncharacterized protein n=1 Tax=Hyperionvirus sp. TaxID=2487770 RepID=A0A3G5A6J9_9VIRU|nr:MAG: hypothetical protein Hyperionvirus3_36 [Hyperionvirus sp.]